MVKTLTIVLDDGRAIQWNLDFSDHGTLQLDAFIFTSRLPWIQLGFCQCPACTVTPRSRPTCPVAEVLAQYAKDLADHKSYERVKVHLVEAEGRHVILTDVPLQTVVGELVRLAVYQTACPVGRRIKPAMSALHLFPSKGEILHALATHFAEQSGENGRTDAEQPQMIAALHEVFGCLSKRLEHAGRGDVYLNAVVIMHSLSLLFSLSAPELIREVMANKRPLNDAPRP